MRRSKEKTTVLFVNKHANGIKPMQISSNLILNWKKYVAFISIVFVSLVCTIVYLTRHNLQQFQVQQMMNHKLRSMHSLFAEVDTNAMRKKITKIDEDLSAINKFLRARGIQNPATKKPQGGEVDNDMLSSEDAADFYERYLTRIKYNLSYTPLGLPFHGAITSSFGHRENPFGGASVETHKGLDIRGPMGAPVKAMAKGEVIFTGRKGGYGNCIVVKHGNGFETLYGHLSKIAVQRGQQIDIAQQIGNIGSTGRSTGPHLHYEIHRNGKRINPESFLTLN